MRIFAKFPVNFWTRQSTKQIRVLSPNHLLVSIYLQTNTHSNMIGLYHLPLQYIAIDTGIPDEQIKTIIDELCHMKYCQYDGMHEYVWIVNFAADQTGLDLKPGDKRVRAIHKLLADMPELSYMDEFLNTYTVHYHLDEEPAAEPQRPSPPPVRRHEYL